MLSLPAGGHAEYLWLKGLVGLTALSLALALTAAAVVGVPTGEILSSYIRFTLTFAPITGGLLLAGSAVAAIRSRAESPIGYARAALARRFANVELGAATLIPILTMPLLLGAFGTLKQVLPLVQPFAWDDRFAAADRLLFLGIQPWRVTHALFGSPAGTVLLEVVYHLWLMLLFIAVPAFAIAAPRYIRARFLLAFGSSWLLLGVLAAALLSSAGPCFTQSIGASSAGQYAELMTRLQALRDDGYLVATLQTQQELWNAYSSSSYRFAMGISAMPSMHNAIAFLYLLALWNAGRGWRIAASAFAVLILLASVHLGWHYAVDGFAAWAGMAVIWRFTGLYLKRCGYEAALGHVEPAGPPATEASEATFAL